MAEFGPYPAEVLGIHDGDTMTLRLDLGFSIGFTCNVRVYGINAPELATPEGKAALRYAKRLVKVGDKITVVSHGWDKYGGRFDGVVTLTDGRDFGGLMLKSKHAVPFMVG